ncbi:hypothetical protein V1477_009830, partial [Vespula maculifrons]
MQIRNKMNVSGNLWNIGHLPQVASLFNDPYYLLTLLLARNRNSIDLYHFVSIYEYRYCPTNYIGLFYSDLRQILIFEIIEKLKRKQNKDKPLTVLQSFSSQALGIDELPLAVISEALPVILPYLLHPSDLSFPTTTNYHGSDCSEYWISLFKTIQQLVARITELCRNSLRKIHSITSIFDYSDGQPAALVMSIRTAEPRNIRYPSNGKHSSKYAAVFPNGKSRS